MNSNENENVNVTGETEPQTEPTEAPEAEVLTPEEAAEAKWKEALQIAIDQRDGYLDQLRRAQADFQNFKRRNATSRSDGYTEGVSESLTAILPAIDNLERALDAAEKAGQTDGLAEGVQMTLNLLLDGLKKFDFEEIPALGETFDPELHNAVMREPGEEPGKILAVFQKGYKAKGKILRYAMVKVASEE